MGREGGWRPRLGALDGLIEVRTADVIPADGEPAVALQGGLRVSLPTETV